MEKYLRPTRAEIDLKAISRNIAKIKSKLKKGTAVLAVVKANAYGHGMLEVSRACISSGVDILGVATIEEGIYLRDNGILLDVEPFLFFALCRKV